MLAEHESQQPSEIEPPASSSVWINDADLLFRDLLDVEPSPEQLPALPLDSPESTVIPRVG